MFLIVGIVQSREIEKNNTYNAIYCGDHLMMQREVINGGGCCNGPRI